jgi:subtilisin family serine protease
MTRGLIACAVFVLLAACPASAAPVHPNDPLFPVAQPALDLIHVPDAWSITEGSPSTIVAVIDKGVSPVADLEGALLPGFDFASGTPDTTDYDRHGTAMASIIAGRIDNGLGSAGVCPQCRILPVKGSLVQAIPWAVGQGAKVLNMSVSLEPHVQDAGIDAAIAAAVAHGVVVILSASNEGSTDPGEDRLASDNPEAIRVAAVDSSATLLPSSNDGPWVDVAAAVPLVAQFPDGSFHRFGKTSTATAAVSGVAALLLTRYPWLTPAQVKSILMATVTPEPGLDVVSGGIVDAYRAVTETPSRPAVQLEVTRTGQGVVIGRPFILCGTRCKAAVPQGTHLALRVGLRAGWRFAGWRGDCSGERTVCPLLLAKETTRVVAVFTRKPKPRR